LYNIKALTITTDACALFFESQHAKASEVNATPLILPTIMPLASVSEAPSNNEPTSEGIASSVTPVTASRNAVIVRRFFIFQEFKQK
jgi:hypothetical protein